MINKFSFIFLFLFFSCNSQERDKISLNINNSVEYNLSSKYEFKKIISTLKEFVNTKNTIFKNNPNWVKYNDKFFSYPFLDIINIEYVNGKIEYKPTLLSITKTNHENTYIVKLGWFKVNKEEEEISLRFIYNLLAIKDNNGVFLLKNILEFNTKKWSIIEIGDIKFYINPEHKFDENNALKFNSINEELSHFFEIDKIKFTYFLCNTNFMLMKALGYDFEETMYFSNQNGSITYPNDNLIFSGNKSEINKHELVHLYTYKKFKNKHKIIDEGIATFLGGSKGLSYEDHLFKLKKHIEFNSINLHDELFKNNYVLDEDTSLMYTLGAFLCDLTIKKGGKKLLFELLDSGNTNEDLINNIKRIFNIKDNDINRFLINELNNYDFKKHK